MSSLQLIEFFEQRRRSGTPMVLVTVIETSGSTYSKAGYRMLIDDRNLYHGLVSGGCLEGDLVEHAQLVLEDGQARVVTYDLRGDEDDELWGLGIGCNGLIRLLLQRLSIENGHEPMRSIANAWQRHAWQRETLETLVCVYDSTHPELPIGMTCIQGTEGAPFRTDSDHTAGLLTQLTSASPVGPDIVRLSGLIGGHPVRALRQRLMTLPVILILGAGPDAVPLVQGFLALGWRVSVADEREGALARKEFDPAGRLYVREDADLHGFLQASKPSAIVVMSHKLRSDVRYLRTVAEYACAYLGILGPAQRRELVLHELEPLTRARIERNLIGPIGLPIGADSPASIAVSVIAQVFLALKTSRPGDEASPPAMTPTRKHQVGTPTH